MAASNLVSPAERQIQVEGVLRRMEGGSSERQACRAEKIPRGTFRSSCLRVDAGVHYARACEAIAKDQVDKLDAVIEEMRAGKITPEMARIEADVRKWVSSRLFRRTWGDKVSAEVTGKDGAPIRLDLSPLTDQELEALEAIRSKLALPGGDTGGEGPAGEKG
jgi:hypothetical protein